MSHSLQASRSHFWCPLSYSKSREPQFDSPEFAPKLFYLIGGARALPNDTYLHVQPVCFIRTLPFLVRRFGLHTNRARGRHGISYRMLEHQKRGERYIKFAKACRIFNQFVPVGGCSDYKLL